MQPLKTKAQIERIKASLLHQEKYRDHCLFVLGINTAFRANELLKLTVGQLSDITAGDQLTVKQSKTNKYRHVPVNKTATSAIKLYFKNDEHLQSLESDTFAFYSARADVLTVPTFSNMVKAWCEGAGGKDCLLYTSPSPRDATLSRMPSSA